MTANIALDEAISIHSLVKRETGLRAGSWSKPYDFNPLPRKEGDSFLFLLLLTCCNFNPLPRKEGDMQLSRVAIAIGISIHSLVKRETANFAKIWLNRILILCTFLLEHKKF